MIKTIAKEAGIVILLLIAVALILGIIFYDYMPINRPVPAKIEAYTFPEDIQNEIKTSVEQGQNIVRTYYIDSTDLDLYEETNDYDKGNPNPFANQEKNENTSNTQANQISSNTVVKNNTIKNNATGSYFNEAGKW